MTDANGSDRLARLLNYPQAAAVLNIPETWLRNNIRQLPHVKIGRYVRFSDAHLDQIRSEREVQPTAPATLGRRPPRRRRRGPVGGVSQ